MAKGQTEIVVVLGIVIVAIVVILYAVPNILPSDVPAGIKPKYDAVKASFESLVMDGAQNTIRKLSLYGGYLDNSSFQMGSVTFLGKEVPYWQYNGQVKYPNVKDNFIQGLRDYLANNKDTVAESLKMSGVALGDPQVSANFLNNKIVITVNMPATIDGYKISKPYAVEVQTRLNEIDEFAKGLASYDASNRPFEYYTLSSMMISPIEQDVHTVPMFIFLTECGDYVFKSWWDLKPAMENVIKTTLAQTYMPGKAPLNTMMSSGSPKYSLVPVNGKRYESLDVAFHLPDDFSLTQADFQFSPDPIMVTSKIIPMVGQCQSDPVYVNYYVSYPAIVRVKDPLTQNVFQFALHVFIKDNKPGVWTESGYESDVQKQICSNPQCAADISLKDSTGKPVDFASITFMGCDLGRTNSQGVLRGPAPCGLGPLQIYKQGYDAYSRMESSDRLAGLTISLVKTPAINAHFYEVIIQNLSLNGKYDISQNAVNVIESGHIVYMNFYDMASIKSYQMGYNMRGGQINGMPAGYYVIGGTLLSKGNELGAFIINYTLSEGLDGKDLYIYLPNELGYQGITDTAQKAGATVTLTNVLIKCGLGPVSLSEIKNFKGCSVGYNEV
ncbi:MAG: hypothetical protein NTY20_00720 [Candidatus Aenigmarchaeota archaeon]|nr:hypothetical protein [Candidatus Aenigmarchaeota archaeon]